MRLYGTEANLFFDVDQGYWDRSHEIDANSRLDLQPRGGTGRTNMELIATDMFKEEIEEFALAIRGRATVEVTVDDSIRALAVVMAAVESSIQGGAPVVPNDLLGRRFNN
jgi:predicted dehydrogenase